MFCGVDIGGTNVEVGLVSEQGELLDREGIKTGKFYSAPDLVLAIAESILRMTKQSRQPLEGIGIGCPNGRSDLGVVVEAANLPFKGIVPMVDLFKRYFPDIPVALANDADAAAVGELYYGKGAGLRDFVVITLGTGLGSGFVANGCLVNGANGMAGEVGHMTMIPDGRPCGCGRNGCLERYVTASGIVLTYNELCLKYQRQPETDNYKDLCGLSKQGDAVAIEAFQKAGEMLGWGLANIALCTAPSHIFLYGGVAVGAGDCLLQPALRSFDAHLLYSYKGTVQIEYSGLLGKNGAILGAASLPRRLK